MSTRREAILKVIALSPGIHFRQLQATLSSYHCDTSSGAISYHLWQLRKERLIAIEKVGVLTCFFSDNVPVHERRLLALLRHPSLRIILSHAAQHDSFTHTEIVALLAVCPSTASWHLRRLIQEGVLAGTGSGYFATDSVAIATLLKKHPPQRSEQLVKNFLSMWDW